MNRDEVLALIDAQTKRIVLETLREQSLIRGSAPRQWARDDHHTWSFFVETTIAKTAVERRRSGPHWSGRLASEEGIAAADRRGLSFRPEDIADEDVRRAMSELAAFGSYSRALPRDLWSATHPQKEV